MKPTKAILFSFLFLIGAASVSAQGTERPDPAERAEKQAERMATVLDLTPEQAEKVREINQSFAERAKAGRADLRKQREAMQEARKAALKSVLTEEQFTKLETLQAQRMERRHEGGGADRGKGKRGSGKERR